MGAGVRGGQVLGSLDSNAQGEAMDLSTGESSSKGTKLFPAHVGATLLALGDVDPGDYLPQGEQPIAAVMK